MILSVSRRTDIPAFYSDWFFNRLNEGYLLVRNPINYHQVSKIILSPNVIDCIVFWTKNPEHMLSRLYLLDNYRYYFQFTLNSYDQTIERKLPKKPKLLDTFKKLSDSIGRDKVIWRYDPILLTDQFTKDYHYQYFDYLANKLKDYTSKCVISFLDLYSKTERNLKNVNLLPLTEVDMREIAFNLNKIAQGYGLHIETCSEHVNLLEIGIKHGKCIDDILISKIIGSSITIDKDKNQREICGCVASIDVGSYNTCRHNCLYCYANFSEKTVQNNKLLHDVNSPLLVGDLGPSDKVYDREMISYINNQISLF